MWTKLTLSTFLFAALSFAADVTGKWTFSVELSAGSGTPSFEFVQTGTELKGTYEGIAGSAPLKGKVTGDAIEFVVETAQGKLAYKGTIQSATEMKGTAVYGEMGDATWTAKKASK